MKETIIDAASSIMIFIAVAVGILGVGMDSGFLLLLSGGLFVGSFVLTASVSDNPVS